MSDQAAITRFVNLHNLAFDGKHAGLMIPNPILRGYLDTVRQARRERTMPTQGTITLSRLGVGLVLANEGLLRAAIQNGWDVRVSGQKW